MKSSVAPVLLAIILFLAACGGATTNVTPTSPPEPTTVFTPIVIEPTNTSVPPPPTPTPRPSSTAAPTRTAAPTQAGATAAPEPTEAPPPAGVDSPMVEIPGGTFMMGSDAGHADAKPAHQVEVEPFTIDAFEVTNADFRKFVDATSYVTDAEENGAIDSWQKYAEGKDDHPVVKVSWNDAKAFCEWAGKRLPTEAEWEFAARGPDGFAFPWGNEFDPKKVNGKESAIRGTTVVGSYPEGASPFQVFDMAGNVWEWTSTLAQHYPGNTNDSKLYGMNNYILRGGGWFELQDLLATHYRNSGVPTTPNKDLGFRCAK